MLARVDHWLRRQEARVLLPHYRHCARELSRVVQQHGLLSLNRDTHPCLLALGAARAALFHQAMERTAAAVEADFEARVAQAYGPVLSRQLLERPPRLFAQVSGGARQAALRLYDLPDRWGYRYSDRIWKSDRLSREELRRALMNAAATGQLSWRVASRLRDLQRADPSLPFYLRQLDETARAVLRGDPLAWQAWTAARRHATLELQRRQPGVLGSRALHERTVRRLERALALGSTRQVEHTVAYYIAQRARSRALTVLRTEVHRAWLDASWAVYRAYPFVIGLRWQLSRATHHHVDECDLKAQADIGFGPGIYHPSDVPLPDHPNGLCTLEPVLAPAAQALSARPPTIPAGYAARVERLRRVGLPRAWNRAGRAGDQVTLAALRRQL